jgi:RimJ/RimL family protein N-acetyltransferase
MEGTLRHAHFARGQHEDVHVMSLLREEWNTMPQSRSREPD